LQDEVGFTSGASTISYGAGEVAVATFFSGADAGARELEGSKPEIVT
jgi:hypothetical protein